MKTFSIAAFGFTPSELSMLQRAFSFTTLVNRTRAYKLIEDIAAETADIAMVNVENDAALNEWSNYQQAHTDTNIPFAAVSTKIPKKSQYQIRLPFYANRVLKVLDEITVKELGYVPELNIGEEDSQAEIGVLDVATVPKPAPKKTETKQPEISGSPEIVVARNTRHTALVVDDNLPVRKQIGLSLSLLGVEAEYAETGEHALELLQTNKYDAVLLEHDLPGMDGYQVCKAIRENPVNGKIPVIMLGKKNTGLNKIRSKMAGCTTFMIKPLSHEEFESISRKYIL